MSAHPEAAKANVCVDWVFQSRNDQNGARIHFVIDYSFEEKQGIML